MGREALDVGQRLVGLAPGLERKPVRELRTAVDQLVDAIRYRDDERSLQVLGKQMIALADRIDELEGVPTPDDEAAITALIGALEDSRQVTSITPRLRDLFGKPNIAIWISEGVVKQVVYRPVNEQDPVRDCILGTRVVGNATMNGVVTADLLPAIGSVRMRVDLTGQINSANRGYNGPVVLRTSAVGNVNASRELYFNESGIRLEPTVVHATLNTQIDAIQHRLRLVRRIARKKAAEQKPQADRIAMAKLKSRVGEKFTQQTDETAQVQPPDIAGKARPILQRLDLTEPPRLWGSTETAVFVNSTFRRDDQISTAIPAPPITTGYDAAVQIHESVVNNAVAPILAGRTLNETKLNDLMSQAGRELPAATDADAAEEDEPPFEIDFARIRPVVFEAREGRIRIGIRGTRFAQGRRELKRPMEITAVYVPARTLEGRSVLVREGDVDVDFPGGRRLTVAQAGLKGTIKKKFADVFPGMLLDQPLQVPDTVEVDALRGRVYHPCLIAADDGWLSLAVR